MGADEKLTAFVELEIGDSRRRGAEIALLHPSDDRRFPFTVEDGLVRPVGANVKGEWPVRRWQPIAFLILAR